MNGHSKLKLMCLFDIFHIYTDENTVFSAAELCEKLTEYGIQAERKSIYSDIETLRAFGLDIISAKSPKRGFYLGKRRFSPDELLLINNAIKSADFIPDKTASGIIAKMQIMASMAQSEKIDLCVEVDASKKRTDIDLSYKLSVIREAIDEKKQLSLSYLGAAVGKSDADSVKKCTLTVNPFLLLLRDGHHLLICGERMGTKIYQLRVERIGKPQVLSVERIEPEKVFGCCGNPPMESFFSSSDGDKEEIILICSDEIVDELLDFFGSDCKLFAICDGLVQLRASAVITDALVSFLLSFGGKAAVSKPLTLRDKVIARAEEIISVYK